MGRKIKEKRAKADRVISGAGSESGSARSDNWMVRAAVLVVATLLLYLPSLRHGFIWDDDTHLTKNILIEPGGLGRSWFGTEQPNYWPITWTAFWLQWKLVGLQPFLYHLTNVLLHGVNAVLVWRILQRLLLPGAFAAAFVFAFHPVNVETAAWVTQLKTLLAMTFYLGSLILWLKNESNSSSRAYGFSIALFAAAMLTKPAPVMMPFVLLLIAWWKERGFSKIVLIRALPYFAIAGVLSLTEIWFQYNVSIHKDVVRTDGIASRLAGAGWVVLFYASKVLMPWKLTFVYPRWEIDAGNVVHWLPLCVLMAIYVLAWVKRNSWGRAVLFGFGYFALTLLPVMGFLNIYYFRYSFVADHWQYVSMVGVVALVVCGGAWWIREKRPEHTGQAKALISAIVAVLGGLTLYQQQIYTSPTVLWHDTLAKNPKAWIAHQQLGVMAAERGDFAAAGRHFADTLRAKPNHAEALYNWGNALAAAGDADGAIEKYREAIKLDPKNAEAHCNLGLILSERGNFAGAEAHFKEATSIRPFADAETNWGLALAAQKRYDEAIEHYKRALEIDKRYDEAQLNWGVALMSQGKPEEAITRYKLALEVNPRLAPAHHNIAMALEQLGRVDEALKHFSAAAEAEPMNPRRQENLARARQRMRGGK